LLALAATLSAAETPRYGAEDPVPEASPRYGAEGFLPTPQQPIGFQADGNGWYPGATPQVVEWWDGKPGWGKVIHRQGTGNQSPPFDDSSYKEMDLRVFTDKVPKNILWKIPSPGHSDAQPVIVGDRIICTFYPHFTVCYDLKTGKELWRDAMEMALLPELGKDRKTVGPAPDPAEARKRQTLFEIAQAMAHLRFNLRDFEGEDPGPAEYPLVQKAVERMGEWRKTLEEVHPPSVALLDEDIALAKRFLAGEHAILGLGQKKMNEDREFHKKVPQFGDPSDFRKNLVNTTAKLLNAPIVGSWPGWMPYHCASPCSDGEIVVVRFCHGQIGAYEVATGKRLWAWRDTEAQLGWTWHANSPRVRGDLVFLDSTGKRAKKPADGDPGTFGIDKRTGSVRWFTPLVDPGNYPAATPVTFDLSGAGSMLEVLVNFEGRILERGSGRVLGTLHGETKAFPHHQESFPLVWGDRVTTPAGNAEGSGGHGTGIVRLSADGSGGLKTDSGTQIPGLTSYRHPWTRNDDFIFDQQSSFDLRTGCVIANAGRLGEHGGSAASVIGPLYVGIGDGDDRKYRPRRDGMVVATCYVADSRPRPYDPPRLISERSLLGGAEAPADAFFDKHLAGFDKMRQINPKKWCGRYGNIISAYFGHYMNGPVARGNRIFIQSQCFLYCIGPAVQGTPADDPKIAAAIRAEADPAKLLSKLSDASAQYRFEAVKRIAELRLPISDLEKASSASPSAIANRQSAISILKSLATEDAYEEIRAQAVLALNASDPQGRAGWDCLMADYAVNFWSNPPPKEGWAYYGNRDRSERRHWHQMTLRALGEQGRAMLEKHWDELAGKPVSLRMAIELASQQRWRIEPLVKAGLDVVQRGPLANTDPWRSQVPVNTENSKVLPDYFAASDAASDPATAEILLKAYPKNWTLYPTFARHLKSEPLLAWIEPIALESAPSSSRPRILNAWKAIGKAALPSMERVRTAMLAKGEADKLAAEYAKAIEETIREMKSRPST
jgi:hypothetical protein